MAGTWRALGLLLTAALGISCGFFSPAADRAPPPLELEVSARGRLNPDDSGRSLPTVVRVYQLRSSARLERADFDRVCHEARESLGDDLLQVDELTLRPGETVKRRIDRERSARHLALVALFRRPIGTSWRAIAELGPPGEGGRLGFTVDGYRVERR